MALTTEHVSAPHDHVVQFYDRDEDLAAGVVPYLADAIDTGGVAIVIATEAHRRAFAAGLAGEPAGAPAATGGSVLWFDAAEVMQALLVDGRLVRHRFDEVVGEVVREAAARAAGRPVRAYGEIVALLWAAGYVTAALELEDWWNDLAREADFSLYCAYPLATLDGEGDAEALQVVCRQHSAVVGRAVELPRLRPVPLALARTFLPVANAPTEARRFTTDTLVAWSRGDLVDDAAVVVSELASNAVVHARSEFTVTVARAADGGIRISVRDASPLLPRPRYAAALAGSGRGLGLVTAMATDWGTDELAHGKVVWADFVS